jgi:uncharacterized protein (TIGR01777 family)
MEYTLLVLLTVQGVMGAFDTIYHHELTERLPWKSSASQELWLHSIRSFFYSLIFISLAWVQWHGIWAWVFMGILVLEVGLTLKDFVVEDQTRKLPATERITHTLLALNYGGILAYLLPELVKWSKQPSSFLSVNHGIFSWVLTLYTIGVLFWGIRDGLRSRLLKKQMARKKVFPKIFPIASNGSPLKILITGGTGMIGSQLCQALIHEGHQITVLTRSFELAASIFNKQQCITLINDLDQFNEAQDIIINLAGAPIGVRWNNKNRTSILQSRIHTTEAVIRFIQRVDKKPKTLISGSAIGVYGTSLHESFTEESRPTSDSNDFAAILCKEWESLASKASDMGVRVCLLRTGVVLGLNGGILEKLLFSYEFGLGGAVGSGRQYFSWIHQDDLLGIIGLCLRTPSISGAINATAPHPVTNQQFSQSLGQVLHRPSFMNAPSWAMTLLFGDMARILLLQGQKVLPKRAIDAGYQFLYPHIHQALDQLLGKK